MLERVGGDEGRGAVFVLDRTRLAQDFRLQTYRDSFWDHVPERSERRCSECEERISGCVFNLHRYLVDVLWIDEKTGSVRSGNRQRDLRKRRPSSVRSNAEHNLFQRGAIDCPPPARPALSEFNDLLQGLNRL
jgi:hypothetical protein